MKPYLNFHWPYEAHNRFTQVVCSVFILMFLINLPEAILAPTTFIVDFLASIFVLSLHLMTQVITEFKAEFGYYVMNTASHIDTLRIQHFDKEK